MCEHPLKMKRVRRPFQLLVKIKMYLLHVENETV